MSIISSTGSLTKDSLHLSSDSLETSAVKSGTRKCSLPSLILGHHRHWNGVRQTSLRPEIESH